MKKHIIILILSAAISNYCQSQNVKKCEYVIDILSIEKISDHLQLTNGKSKRIRIVDIKNYFKNCKCETTLWDIGVINEVPVDINSGRSIDFVILNVKKKKKTVEFTFFYTLSGQLDLPNLWSGNVIFETIDDKIKIVKFSIYNVQ